MLKSISAWAFSPQRPAGEIFRMAKDHGFEGVEVSIGADGAPANQVWLDSTEDDCKRLVEPVRQRDAIRCAGVLGVMPSTFQASTETRAWC